MKNTRCDMCRQPAGPHNYYGARACIPCRAFFRRSVTEKLHYDYVCYRFKNCNIGENGRKACRYCRYQLCLQSGMKPSYVLNEKKLPIKADPDGNNDSLRKISQIELSKCIIMIILSDKL